MHYEYSFDQSVEKIAEAQTAEYFREVLNSYMNGNFRSAVVGLWSVIVCDLVYKAQRLEQEFNDANAKAVLDDIRLKAKSNPKSSEWESDLLAFAQERLGWLDLSERLRLEEIQRLRHLCAHPVLGDDGRLATPSRDEVRAKVRLALDLVLTRPAVATGNITDKVLEHLERLNSVLPTNASVAAFLDTTYLGHLDEDRVARLFRSFWKLVFGPVNDPRCELNRTVNLRALIHFAKRLDKRAEKEILGAPQHYANIAPQHIPLLSKFLVLNPRLFPRLSQSAQQQIRTVVEGDNSLFAQAWYLSGSLETQLAAALKRFMAVPYGLREFKWPALGAILRFAIEQGKRRDAIEFAFAIYELPDTYDNAKSAYHSIIAPFIAVWQEEEFAAFFAAAAKNDQTYTRTAGKTDHRRVVDAFVERFGKNLSLPKNVALQTLGYGYESVNYVESADAAPQVVG